MTVIPHPYSTSEEEDTRSQSQLPAVSPQQNHSPSVVSKDLVKQRHEWIQKALLSSSPSPRNTSTTTPVTIPSSISRKEWPSGTSPPLREDGRSPSPSSSSATVPSSSTTLGSSMRDTHPPEEEENRIEKNTPPLSSSIRKQPKKYSPSNDAPVSSKSDPPPTAAVSSNDPHRSVEEPPGITMTSNHDSVIHATTNAAQEIAATTEDSTPRMPSSSDDRGTDSSGIVYENNQSITMTMMEEEDEPEDNNNNHEDTNSDDSPRSIDPPARTLFPNDTDDNNVEQLSTPNLRSNRTVATTDAFEHIIANGTTNDPSSPTLTTTMEEEDKEDVVMVVEKDECLTKNKIEEEVDITIANVVPHGNDVNHRDTQEESSTACTRETRMEPEAEPVAASNEDRESTDTTVATCLEGTPEKRNMVLESDDNGEKIQASKDPDAEITSADNNNEIDHEVESPVPQTEAEEDAVVRTTDPDTIAASHTDPDANPTDKSSSSTTAQLPDKNIGLDPFPTAPVTDAVVVEEHDSLAAATAAESVTCEIEAASELMEITASNPTELETSCSTPECNQRVDLAKECTPTATLDLETLRETEESTENSSAPATEPPVDSSCIPVADVSLHVEESKVPSAVVATVEDDSQRTSEPTMTATIDVQSTADTTVMTDRIVPAPDTTERNDCTTALTSDIVNMIESTPISKEPCTYEHANDTPGLSATAAVDSLYMDEIVHVGTVTTEDSADKVSDPTARVSMESTHATGRNCTIDPVDLEPEHFKSLVDKSPSPKLNDERNVDGTTAITSNTELVLEQEKKNEIEPTENSTETYVEGSKTIGLQFVDEVQLPTDEMNQTEVSEPVEEPPDEDENVSAQNNVSVAPSEMTVPMSVTQTLSVVTPKAGNKTDTNINPEALSDASPPAQIFVEGQEKMNMSENETSNVAELSCEVSSVHITKESLNYTQSDLAGLHFASSSSFAKNDAATSLTKYVSTCTSSTSTDKQIDGPENIVRRRDDDGSVISALSRTSISIDNARKNVDRLKKFKDELIKDLPEDVQKSLSKSDDVTDEPTTIQHDNHEVVTVNSGLVSPRGQVDLKSKTTEMHCQCLDSCVIT